MRTFRERLSSASEQNRSLLCVGLDPDPARMPTGDIVAFNSAIVDATRDLVCAYKPNVGFYEARGSEGIRELERTIAHIRDVAPSVILLLDGKRGDIGSTNAAYAKALFETWGADAATINGYAGGADALGRSWPTRARRVFVWCRSSNEGAAELQDLPVLVGRRCVALLSSVRSAGRSSGVPRAAVGLVVGATYPKRSFLRCEAIAPDVCADSARPGVGASGGFIAGLGRGGCRPFGTELAEVSSSRRRAVRLLRPGRLRRFGQKRRGSRLAGRYQHRA